MGRKDRNYSHPISPGQSVLHTLWRHRHPYLFITPFFLLFFVFLLFPIGYSFYLSFHQWNGILPARFIGASNYGKVFFDEQLLQAAANTLVFSFFSVTLTTILALLLAMMLNSVRTFRGFFRSVFFLPSVVSLVVVGIVWKILLNSQIGLLPDILTQLQQTLAKVPGLPSSWFESPWSLRLLDSHAHVPGFPSISLPLMTLVFIQLWASVGFSTVIYLAGLQGIPTQLYEAATMDGADRFQCFRHVTLPMLRPTTFFVVLMGTVDALQVFVLPNVMTRDRESTMSIVYFMYRQAFEYQRMGYASAIAYCLFFVTVGLGFLISRLFGEESQWSRAEAD